MLQGRTGTVPIRPAKNFGVITRSNNLPGFSSAQSKFGGGSLLFTSSSTQAFVIQPAQYSWAATGYARGVNGGLQFGNTGEFTIEAFIYRITNNGEAQWFDQGSGGVSCGFRSGTGFYFAQSQVSYGVNVTTGATTGAWQHFCATRDSANVIRIYIDGTYRAQGASPTYTGAATVGTPAARCPCVGFQAGNIWLNGYINEFRISNINRYPVANTANITVPTAPFVNDANTLVLIHGTQGLNDDNT